MFEIFKLKKTKRQYELKQYDIALKLLEEASHLSVRDVDEDDWVPLAGDVKGIEQADISRMQKQAYEFWLNNPHARGVIRTLEKFTLGRGVDINAVDENPVVQEWWDEFEIENKFSRRQDEIIRRTLRDGEVFIRYYINKRTGKTKIRFIDPIQIADPLNKHSFGIETDPDDIETPINYIRAKDSRRIEIIPTEEIQHIKIFADSNVKRGISFLYHIIPLFKKYEDWLNDRVVLNKVRAAVAIIKTIKGGPEQFSQITSNQQSTKSNVSQRAKMLKPGSVITVNEGVDYKFIYPALQAQDVQYDGRNILLAMAVASGLPEFIVTGDASNANFASTMVAQNPAVREFEDWQKFLELEFQIMFRKVIQAGIEYGKIPHESKRTKFYYDGNRENKVERIIPTNINCDVQFPPLIHRDIKQETDSIIMALNAGLISEETAAAKLGYDFEKEQEEIKKWLIKQGAKYEKERDREIDKDPEEIAEPE